MSYNTNDYYKLLNITQNATQKEIKIAYRKRAHELHPDKNKKIDTTEQFQKLNKAYDVLSNSKKRQEYDIVEESFNFTIKIYGGEVDTRKYSTNIENLTCCCPDWLINRKQFLKNDLRRLCKHIIAKLEVLEINPIYNSEDEFCNAKELKLPNSLIKFKNEIISCRTSRCGIDLYLFHELIVLELFIIYISKHRKNINMFSKKYYKSIYIDFNCQHVNPLYRYTCSNKQIFFKFFLAIEIESFFKHNFSNCIDFLESFSKYNDFIDEEDNEVNKAWENGYLISSKFEYGLPFFIYDKDIDIPHSTNNITYKKNLKLQKINDIKLKCTQYKEYLKFKNKNLLQYHTMKNYTIQNLLKIYKSNINIRKFNSVLKEMEFIIKANNLNHNNWIIKGDGLEFGINYADYSMYSHIKIPDWYVITKFDIVTLSFEREYRYGLLYTTKIFWKKNNFKKLLKLVENYILESKKINEKKKISEKLKKQIINKELMKINRKIELNGLTCYRCNSENIHKKDKRQRKNYKVQRYQCMDCKSIFQEKIIE